jgi:AraC-like DNA-binding protein
MSGPVAMRTLYLDPRLRRLPAGGCRVIQVSPLLRELIVEAVARGGLARDTPVDAHLLAVIRDQLRALPERPLHIPRPREPRAVRLAELLEKSPEDRRSLTVLCRGVGASRRTLERIFSRETGMSIGRWRRQHRLGHALGLLAAGTPVTSVALDVGYDSPSAFVAAFRAAFGQTPGRYFGPR